MLILLYFYAHCFVRQAVLRYVHASFSRRVCNSHLMFILVLHCLCNAQSTVNTDFWRADFCSSSSQLRKHPRAALHHRQHWILQHLDCRFHGNVCKTSGEALWSRSLMISTVIPLFPPWSSSFIFWHCLFSHQQLTALFWISQLCASSFVLLHLPNLPSCWAGEGAGAW